MAQYPGGPAQPASGIPGYAQPQYQQAPQPQFPQQPFNPVFGAPQAATPTASWATTSQLQWGGVGARMFAHASDLIIIIVAWLVVSLIFGVAGAIAGGWTNSGDSFSAYEGSSVLAAVILLIVTFLYFPMLEAIWGQTLGKKIFGLKVVHLDGSKIGFGAAFLRYFMWLIDGLFVSYLIGLVLISVMPKRQRVGDMAANTVVVKSR